MPLHITSDSSERIQNVHVYSVSNDKDNKEKKYPHLISNLFRNRENLK